MATKPTTRDTPPAAEIRPRETTVHGTILRDDYFWLRDREDPAVRAYLEAENAHTDACTSHTKELTERVYEEMKGRIQETDLSVPSRKDDYFYYARTEEGKAYPIHCRRKGSMEEGAEELLLDENAAAEGQAFFALGAFAISPDHRYLAYSVDFDGGEKYTLRVKDLETGEHLPDEIENTSTSLEWAADNRTLFYNTLDEAMRPDKLHRHRLGEPSSEDRELFHEADEIYWLSLTKTRSDAWLVLELGSTVTTEAWILAADDPDGKFRCVAPRQPEVEYYVEHHRDRFFIVTNEDAVNFKLMETPVSSPTKENWRERIPHRDDVYLTDVDAFREHLVIHERVDGRTEMRVEHLGTGDTHTIGFDEPVFTLSDSSNPEFDTSVVRFVYTSLVTPRSVYDYDMNTKERTLRKRQPVLGGYDPNDYETERVSATSRDGTRVPISIVHRKGIERSGDNPTLLYGYGSYGIPVDPTFGSNRLSLLDRGFVFAIAHIRGGCEMGRRWYDAGKLEHKRNTFLDFIAAAETLVEMKYTRRERLGIMGGSAGGLLVGAVLNMRPDLCGAAVAQVPFVDVVNTMLDPTLPLTITEYEQWGDPSQEGAFERILDYSPYDNVRAIDYPDILVTAGWNDPRVQYWEPAKWVAKLRATKSGDGALLLKTNLDAGHSGASGRYDALREIAFEYVFLIDRLAPESAR